MEKQSFYLSEEIHSSIFSFLFFFSIVDHQPIRCFLSIPPFVFLSYFLHIHGITLLHYRREFTHIAQREGEWKSGGEASNDTHHGLVFLISYFPFSQSMAHWVLGWALLVEQHI